MRFQTSSVKPACRGGEQPNGVTRPNAAELLRPEDAPQAWYSLLEREGKTRAHGRKVSHKAFGSLNAEKLFLALEVRVLT